MHSLANVASFWVQRGMRDSCEGLEFARGIRSGNRSSQFLNMNFILTLSQAMAGSEAIQ